MSVVSVSSQGVTPPPHSENSLFNPTIVRPLFGFSMPNNNRDYLYGIPTLMVDFHTNMSKYSDNAVATTPLYNHQNASASTINNMGRLWGICYIPQTTPSLNTTSMMVMRQQINESNLELVNTITQKMGTIFNPLITNTNQTYDLLANQMRWIDDFFGTPHIPSRPTPQISNEGYVEMPENGLVQANVSQNQGLRYDPIPNREEMEYVAQVNSIPLTVHRNQDADQVL